MITVAYNDDPQIASTDTFLLESSKAKTKHPFTSLGTLASVPSGQSLLIVADHGLPGVQGVGSGSGRDTSWGRNLNHEHFSVFQEAQRLPPSAAYTNPQWLFYWAGLRGAGTNDKQTEHVMTLFSKIDSGGVVFLAGCNVGDGDEGASLLQDLALIAQRYRRVLDAGRMGARGTRQQGADDQAGDGAGPHLHRLRPRGLRGGAPLEQRGAGRDHPIARGAGDAVI